MKTVTLCDLDFNSGLPRQQGGGGLGGSTYRRCQPHSHPVVKKADTGGTCILTHQLPACLPACLSVGLPAFLSVGLPACLFLSLYPCLSVSLSLCLSPSLPGVRWAAGGREQAGKTHFALPSGKTDLTAAGPLSSHFLQPHLSTPTLRHSSAFPHPSSLLPLLLLSYLYQPVLPACLSESPKKPHRLAS